MQEYYSSSPTEVSKMSTRQLRESFLIQDLFTNDKVNFIYSHYDRMIVGGAAPATETISLTTYEPLKSSFFLERREMGIINVGGEGTIKADDAEFHLSKMDCVYLGRGTKEVSF